MGRSLVLVALLIVLRVNQSTCLKCYTCGEPSTLHHSSGSVMPCREFDEATGDQRALERFIVECSSEFVSCTTQKQGNQVSRNCDTLQIDDCQVANGVTYCFCTHDLCNEKMSETPVPPPMEPHHQTTDLEQTIDLSDDEDYSEMSGNGSNENHMKEASEEIAVEAPFNGINNETRESSTKPMDEAPKQHYFPNSACCRRVSGFGLGLIVLLYGLVAALL